MKKFFAFAIMLAAISLSACGGGDKKDKESQESQCCGNCEQCETPCDKGDVE